MTEKPMAKTYDLEERTTNFTKDTRTFVKRLPRTIANSEDIKQLVRASGSVGANYIEANDSLSKKDFLMRIKICRKEAKECRYWIQLIHTGEDSQFLQSRDQLHQEATELMNIFGAILRKSETKNQNQNSKHENRNKSSNAVV